MSRKYTCEKGSFSCRYCGTTYPYSDLRDACEGRQYYREWQEHPAPILDELRAEIGELVLVTIYVGNDYAQPPFKGGLQLLYRWEKVRDKRIIPIPGGDTSLFDKRDESFIHMAEYKIGEISPIDKAIVAHWDVTIGACGMTVGFAVGPRHVWSKNLVENLQQKKWPDAVLESCYGEYTPDTRAALKAEGYEVY
jgi:hypothetical protein